MGNSLKNGDNSNNDSKDHIAQSTPKLTSNVSTQDWETNSVQDGTSLHSAKRLDGGYAKSITASIESIARSAAFPRSSIEGDATMMSNETFKQVTNSGSAQSFFPRNSTDGIGTNCSTEDVPSRTLRNWQVRNSEDGTQSFHTGRANDLGHWALEHHRHGLIHAIKLNRRRANFRGPSTRTGSKSDVELEGDTGSRNRETGYRINFAELQRMRLRKLQSKLVKHVVDMKYHAGESSGWEADLQDYTKAIQDYDYMIKCSQSPRDPFLVTGERSVDDFVLRQAMQGIPTKPEDFGPPILVPGPWEEDSQPIGLTRNNHVATTWIEGFKERLAIAAVAGFFLVGPMWLMVLHNTLYTCLVSTTVFVIVFGFIMAWSLNDSKDVMAGTAAYAAVLVVFVGLGNPNTEVA